jgi:hypothetical protein
MESMQEDAKKFWFPAKNYGYGWGLPSCWQGWLVLASYLLLVSGGAFLLQPGKHLAGYLGYVGALSVILIIVCWIKGEKARWRWKNK